MGSYFFNQGWNLKPLALEAQGVNHWTAKEVLLFISIGFGPYIISTFSSHLLLSPCVSIITPHPPPPAVLQLLWRFNLVKNFFAMLLLFLQIQKSASSLRAFALASSAVLEMLFF